MFLGHVIFYGVKAARAAGFYGEDENGKIVCEYKWTVL